ncbi:MAG: M23 family metallopeptidase [Nannocystaceae bacterium]
MSRRYATARACRTAAAVLGLSAMALLPSLALAGGGTEPFEFMPPGQLTPGSGSGRFDENVYAPGMRFPMESGPAFANSQVWGYGGGQGPGGGQCSTDNYDYPWWDNYCETRSWDMPMCPAGIGHQGQDIRPATCDDLTHWNVASDAGTITNIGSYSVYVTSADGIRYDFLHGGGNIVAVGQSVERGARLNRVSNEFGGTPTTIHLHFNLRMDVAGFGSVYAPTYMSLVTSYQELMGLVGNGEGAVEQELSDCEALRGWAQTGDDPEGAATVLVSFDAPQDDPAATVVQVLADRPREDLCGELGSCDHGFEVEVPLRLRDTQGHDAYFYVVGSNGSPVELEGSPATFSCTPPPLPEGVRRELGSPEVMAAWAFSPLWQVAWAAEPDITALEPGLPFPELPVLVYSDADPAQERWLMDPGYKRRVTSEEVATAWGLSWDDAEPWPAVVLDEVPAGTPLRPVPFLVAGDDGVVYSIDDAQCPLDDDGQPDPDCEGEGDSDGGVDDTAGDEPPGGTAGDDGGTAGVPLPPGMNEDDSGCGCHSGDQEPTGTWWLLVLVGGLRRRRRRR